MVYVSNVNNEPLMPTCRYAKVRVLIKKKIEESLKAVYI